MLPPHQRYAKEEQLLDQLFEPPVVAQPGGAEPEIGVPAGAPVHQCLDAELPGEALELSRRGGTLLEVYEVGLDPALGEETQGLAGVSVLADAENLDFHAA